MVQNRRRFACLEAVSAGIATNVHRLFHECSGSVPRMFIDCSTRVQCLFAVPVPFDRLLITPGHS